MCARSFTYLHLKECIAELVPHITDIVNMSLRESMIPKSLKNALIRPLLKKTGLDSDLETLSPGVKFKGDSMSI